MPQEVMVTWVDSTGEKQDTSDTTDATKNTGPLPVTALVGTGAASLGKAEDAAHASGDVGIMALAVQNEAVATFSATALDYVPMGATRAGVVFTAPLGPTGVSDATIARTVLTTDNNASLAGVAISAFNGGSWDRFRSNNEATGLVSAARTATTATADLVNYNGRLAVVMINVSVMAAGGLTLAIRGKAPTPATYFQLHANFAKITATGLYVYVVGLSALTAAAGGITAVAQAPIPRTWDVNVVADDATSITYSIDIVTLL